MAAGEPLFAGDTVVETLAAVVTRTPDLHGPRRIAAELECAQ